MSRLVGQEQEPVVFLSIVKQKPKTMAEYIVRQNIAYKVDLLCHSLVPNSNTWSHLT